MFVPSKLEKTNHSLPINEYWTLEYSGHVWQKTNEIRGCHWHFEDFHGVLKAFVLYIYTKLNHNRFVKQNTNETRNYVVRYNSDPERQIACFLSYDNLRYYFLQIYMCVSKVDHESRKQMLREEKRSNLKGEMAAKRTKEFTWLKIWIRNSGPRRRPVKRSSAKWDEQRIEFHKCRDLWKCHNYIHHFAS